MGKYTLLWEYVERRQEESFQLSFEEIQVIAGVPVDHSFLTNKKELTKYGYKVGKISMKGKTVTFCRQPLKE